MDSREKKWIGARMGWIAVLILAIGATNAAALVTGLPQVQRAGIENDRARNSSGADIQFNRGVMYYIGQGVAQDFVEAAKWFRLAADQGDAAAQGMLGGRYAKGQGVAPDWVAAYALFNLSATNDPSKDNPDIKSRTALVNLMSADELKTGQRLSREMAKPGNFLKALDAYLRKPGKRVGKTAP
jgi:hypothetical protein